MEDANSQARGTQAAHQQRSVALRIAVVALCAAVWAIVAAIALADTGRERWENSDWPFESRGLSILFGLVLPPLIAGLSAAGLLTGVLEMARAMRVDVPTASTRRAYRKALVAIISAVVAYSLSSPAMLYEVLRR